MTNTLALGQEAELAAEQFLQSKGMQNIERNFRCKAGELDLVMRDREQLVFVEVRYRKNSRYGSPASTVTAHKQRKLRAAATYYLKINKQLQTRARFDVIGVQPSAIRPSEYDYQWIKNAF